MAQSPTINALSFEARIAQDSRATQVEEAALVALVSLVLAHTLVMVTMSSRALVAWVLPALHHEAGIPRNTRLCRRKPMPPKEGDPITLAFYTEGRLIPNSQFLNYWWRGETYKKTFEEVGFLNFTCHSLHYYQLGRFDVLPKAIMKASKG